VKLSLPVVSPAYAARSGGAVGIAASWFCGGLASSTSMRVMFQFIVIEKFATENDNNE